MRIIGRLDKGYKDLLDARPITTKSADEIKDSIKAKLRKISR